MKRKKYGSSYIVVIIIFMFVSTVSMAMLSMISANYKARVVESKRVENLYSSESGLDVAYNLIGKTFDAAAQYGNLRVKRLQSLTKDSNDDETSPYNQDFIDLKIDIDYWKEYNSNHDKDEDKKSQQFIDKKIEEDNEMLDVIINQEFKRAFNNFILKYSGKDYADKEIVPNKLRESIINKSYVNGVRDLNDNELSYDIAEIQFPDNNNPPNLSINDAGGIRYDTGNDLDVKSISLQSSGKQLSLDVYNKEKYTITIQSEFESKGQNTNVIGKNMRTVQATYTMFVPNYNDVYFTKSTGNLQKYPALENRGITVGGNMDIDNLSNLQVTGDVFVKGDRTKISGDYGIVYNKYKGGITLENVKNFTFDNVMTNETFNIGNNVGQDNDKPAQITSNLYARNLYAGNINGNQSSYSNLSIGNLVVDNDITLKANSTNIKINNFYGINERTVNDEESEEKDKNSSCIIVNGNSNSKVDIKNSAYIMGVAYIDTKDQPYKTGESLAFKGNYSAYSVPDPSTPNEIFSYHDPLYLFDGTNSSNSNSGNEVAQKRVHFEDYWDGKLKEENTGGISLPSNTKAVGAIIYKDLSGKFQVKNDATNLINDNDIEDIIDPKREEYAQKVYNMGYPQKDYDKLTESEKTYLKNLYDLKSTSNPQYTIENIMKLPEDIDESNSYKYSAENEAKEINDNDAEKAIFTKKNIVISGDNASENYDDTGDYIFINASNNKEIDALIGTDGDVIIDGNVNFRGSIIAKGNLIIKGKTNGNSTSLITYDPEIVERIESQNTELFNDIFGGTIYTGGGEESDSGNEILNPNYDINKFLNTKLWKLVK
ncbi:hypothetical protein [Clostridium beijerinckii]|uniref:Uncharacterized protein n=1 Tax=Clostridium beijerinckii TaxID=1520 RepID=A0AAE5H2H6_CLOBE|nr:hypothetical protein [Clostridium beijerinckii]NSB13057.1 hypothetical protein [Clostridium beijerinckii]OOM23687.1 hypothetical protein CLOBE_40450 [Clostridium beijerinckii]